MQQQRLAARMLVREREIVYRALMVDAVLRRVRSSEDVCRLLDALGATNHAAESLWVIRLESRGKVLAAHECARGPVASVPVDIRDVFRSALLVGASAVVIAHNHPSDKLTPITEDHSSTMRVREAGSLLGVGVADHVIVSGGGHFSFLEAGLWTLSDRELRWCGASRSSVAHHALFADCLTQGVTMLVGDRGAVHLPPSRSLGGS